MYEKYIKRILDAVCSFILLVLLLPVFTVMYFCTLISLGTPTVFKQKRPGKNGKAFTLYKFRTMDKRYGLSDESRLKPMGAFFRKYHMDELPELVNILKGDMSFVGPRPQLMKDMAFFDSETAKRQNVRPGLTGLAQSYGAPALRWDIKFKYDLEYIEKITFPNDLKIIARTVKTVISGSGKAVDDSGDYGDWLLKNGMITREEYECKLKGVSE